MTKRQIISFILLMIIGISFFGCDLMATLFHGEKPPVIYTVTFDANGADGTPPEEMIINSGTVIILPGKGDMSSEGNIFVGWSESSDGGITYSDGEPITVKREMIFYAQWFDPDTPQYTVTFSSNGATGAVPSPQKKYRDISIILPGKGNLALSDKIFGGWNTQANGGGTNYEAGAVYKVTEDVTLYARWKSKVQFTVTYNANGASGAAPPARTEDPGTEITLPGVENMSYFGKSFEGWNTKADCTGTDYAEGALFTVSANITLYAKWLSVPIEPPGATVADKLAYIRNKSGDDGIVYDIVVEDNLTMSPITIATKGRNVTVIIHSESSLYVKTIQIDSESRGSLFSVDPNITLKLQDIVLKGISSNNSALVQVGARGKLVLNSGSKITSNSNNSDSTKGGGVYINGGTLEMNDGCEISGNSGGPGYGNGYAQGGGIYVDNKGTVTINGGLISGNTARPNIFIGSGNGGGIFIAGSSKVTMTGGEISKNSARSYGGGVYIADSDSSFIKQAAAGTGTSGMIYGGTGAYANTAYSASDGHAVYRNFGTLRARYTSLGEFDGISTKANDGWEE